MVAQLVYIDLGVKPIVIAAKNGLTKHGPFLDTSDKSQCDEFISKTPP
jgi:hypothetical protein